MNGEGRNLVERASRPKEVETREREREDEQNKRYEVGEGQPMIKECKVMTEKRRVMMRGSKTRKRI